MGRKKYVSDVIGNEYKEWTNKDVITINCQTGQGKTYFILNKFAKYYNDKSILFIVNRSKLSNQVFNDIQKEKLHNVTVTTYQSIQNKLINNEFINTYDILVMDEIHYVLLDSWNDYSDIFWTYITEQCTNKMKIFMTGTGRLIFKMIDMSCKITHSYETKRNYSYIQKVKYYKGDKDNSYVKDTLKKIKKKAIYFSSSAKKAYDMSQVFKDDSLFVCSKSNPEYGKLTQIDEIKDEKFETKYLMATKVIDNGVNIKDKEVKNIFCDIIDDTTLLQCIGRKRIIDNRDRLTLHIRNYTEKELQSKIKQLQYDLDMARPYCYKINSKNKMKKHQKQIPTLCYVDSKTNMVMVNKLRFIYTTALVKDLTEMKERGYMNCINYTLGIDEKKVEVIDMIIAEEKEDEIKTYLEKNCGNALQKQQQEELIDLIGLKDKRGRQQKSIGSLNSYLQENKYNYEIVSIQKTIDSKRQRIWIIGEK